MTHYLSSLFSPRSVALFGASDRAEAVGTTVLSNLLAGKFHGVLFPINPKREYVQGILCYPDINAIVASTGKPVDLAVVATPASTVPGILDACGQAGTKRAIVISAGFGEAGPEGKKLEQEVLKVARKHQMRFVGPNCLGLMRPSVGFNATFGKSPALPGELALISQSGALCTAILDWAESQQVGFSTVVSTGAAADVDFGEILDFLATDPVTRSILLYIEGIRDARRFLSNLRPAARMKPVIVMKPGRHPAASKAAVSHTGALVGADDVFDAALERAGVVRVNTIQDLFSAARTLSGGMKVHGKRLGIVTNGGGPGVIAADAISEQDMTIPELQPATIAALDKVLPPHWSKGNPVDVLGDAGPDRYKAAVNLVLDDPNADGVLVMLTPQAMTDPEGIARVIIEAWKSRDAATRKPLIACWMGRRHVESGHRLFTDAGVPSFHTPEAAVTAFAQLWHYHRNQEILLEVPGPLTDDAAPRIEDARRIVEGALAEGRTQLSQVEGKALLAAFHIPVADVRKATTAEEAAANAQQLGFPIVMKIDSPNLSHKSDVGGVELNLRDAEQVKTAFTTMMQNVRAKAPQAELHGVIVERQWSKAHTRELLVGVIRDPIFGPAITFGWGGTTVEVLKDRAISLPPLNAVLIRRMISRTKVARLLGQFRNQPPVDSKIIESVLLRLSELVCELPQVAEMEINPLSCDESAACALDVRVFLTRDTKNATAPGQFFGHMAIPPFPKHLQKIEKLPDGTDITVRPIRPEDAEMERRFVRELSEEAKYLRFMHALQELSPEMLERFTQVDYDREMAYLASIKVNGEEVEIGTARYTINPDGETCEFGIVVNDEWQGRGVGTVLMQTLMEEAKTKQIKQIEGQVLAGNFNMLKLMKALGFTIETSKDSPDIKQVSLRL